MKGVTMGIDKIPDNEKTVYIKGEPKLVDTKTSEKTTGSIMVSNETTVTSSETKNSKELVVFPKKEKAVQNNGEIVYSKDLSDEQIKNLKKLDDAQKFMQTDEGKKLAESLLNQQMDISKGQRKWLKKQGIDADAFIQEWNRQNPDSPNNKKFAKEKAEDARSDMAAYAKGFLGDQQMKSNKPVQEKESGLKGMFKKSEKEKITKDTTYSDQGMKIKHHSSTDESRQSSIANDVTDEIARKGKDFLEAFEGNNEGKRRAKFKEIDENGNEVTYKVRYNKDGSVKKVVVKSDAEGKLKVKQAKDGDITVKGDLQAEFAYEDAPTIANIKEKNVQKFEEVKTVTTDNTYLQVDKEIRTKTKEQTKIIKPDCPEPDTSYMDLRGKYVSDLPRRDRNFNQGPAVDAKTILQQADQMGMENLVKGYCGNRADAKYEPSSEPGNLNQLNARFITGCFINAHETNEKGPNGRNINGMSADYEKLNAFIGEAFNRDQEIISVAGPKADNQILKYIAMEINRHNASVAHRSGKHLPGTNNYPIDKAKLPEFFQKYIK